MLALLLFQATYGSYPDGSTALNAWDLEEKTEVAILSSEGSASQGHALQFSALGVNGSITVTRQTFKVLDSSGKLPGTITLVYPGEVTHVQAGPYTYLGFSFMGKYVALVRAAEYGAIRYAPPGNNSHEPVWREISGSPGEFVPVAIARCINTSLPSEGPPLLRFSHKLVAELSGNYGKGADKLLSAMREVNGTSVLRRIAPNLPKEVLARADFFTITTVIWSSVEFGIKNDERGAVDLLIQQLPLITHKPTMTSNVIAAISENTHSNAWKDLTTMPQCRLWEAIASSGVLQIGLELMRFTKSLPPQKVALELIETYRKSMSFSNRFRFLEFLAARANQPARKPIYEVTVPGPIKDEQALWDHWKKMFSEAAK